MRNILSVCPYCGTGCCVYLKVKDNRVIGIMPSRLSSSNRGRLCVKGWNAWEFIHHPDRLKKPLIKIRGKFREVTWDTALEKVVNNFKNIKAQYGSDSLGVWGSARCTNEMNYLAQKLARAVFGTNNVDHCARTCHSPTVAGLVRAFGSGAMTNSYDEIPNAKGIFAIGSNAPEAHPIIWWRIRTAKDNGAKIIVADPRKTSMAEIADIHLQHYPGTDIPLLNAMINVIIKEDLHDKSFIERCTEGFEELRIVVQKYTPEYVSKITGVNSNLIKEAARLYATLRPLSNIYTLGITEHTVGTENVMSIANLAMLTGNVGKKSSGVNPLRGQNNVQGACDMGVLPNVYPGYQKVENDEIRKKFERAWKVELSLKPGLTISDMIIQARSGKIKALYIIGEDPMRSDPNINHVKEAIERLEFLVVQEIFMNKTAEFADVVLPGASFAEKDGTFTNSERRIQRIRKAIEPLGEARADWKIICDISNRMGYPMRYKDTEQIMDEIASLVPIYRGISFKRIDRDGLQWPCINKKHSGTRYLHKDGRFTRGLGRFHAIEHRPPAEEPDSEYPFILTTGRMLFHYNVGTMSRRTPALDREYPNNFVEINPDDAKKLGIEMNTNCKVSTRRGQIIVKAQINKKIKEGVIWIPFHFTESPANLLTNDAFCPIARTGEYKACAAKVEKI
jgi:formate dehydrogenase alpha subunit